MPIAQCEASKEEREAVAEATMQEKLEEAASSRINPWLEGSGLLVSFIAFTLGIYLLLGAVFTSSICLAPGCYSKAKYPLLYWTALAFYAALIPLMAYVFTCDVRTVNQAIQRWCKHSREADALD